MIRFLDRGTQIVRPRQLTFFLYRYAKCPLQRSQAINCPPSLMSFECLIETTHSSEGIIGQRNYRTNTDKSPTRVSPDWYWLFICTGMQTLQ